jgi:hypothetical protein
MKPLREGRASAEPVEDFGGWLKSCIPNSCGFGV